MSDQTHDDPWLYQQYDRIHSSTCEEGPNHDGPCHPSRCSVAKVGGDGMTEPATVSNFGEEMTDGD